ncbi:hypothetical protein [Streptomyces sp. DH41]|uniref:hypothetical protein n=1 Tax=Streptomyces sp. DH41 TaxID=3040125 RepID=UPI002442BEA6|nr:hypothetical protein [Streptomyces sp. DH41]MDG9722876.1 hypothetical protein [Streptomyces sp. DH41]
MTYPLVRELAAAAAPPRVPVAVTCRVLGLARQPYYRWLARPVTDTELAGAYRADALEMRLQILRGDGISWGLWLPLLCVPAGRPRVCTSAARSRDDPAQ